jgi:L-aspartate oxidase
VLASGGIGHLYAITTNPPQACGIGLAIAARAGAVLADTEFVQFHPTAIAVGCDPAPLASEALRGEGAILVNGAGEQFMLKVHPDGDMAPRDVVARGVFAEIAAGHGAFLDARTAIGPEFPERFPTVYASCLAAGVDPVRMPIPVAPAAHYHMGGVQTDARGRTSLAGLWAAGEVASTGVHGANRLASNSLLEAVVFATRVAEDISGMTSPSTFPQRASTEPRSSPDAASLSVRDLRTTMSRHVGVIRNRDGLATALERISCIEREAKSTSLRNMATAALLVAAAAFARHESRGAHERSDYPRPDPALARRTFLTLAEARTIAAEAIHDSHRSIPAG